MKLVTYALGGVLIFLLIKLLTVTKALLIPFVIALFLFVVLRNSSMKISKVLPRFVKPEKLRNGLGDIISFILLGVFIFSVYQVINGNIQAVVDAAPKYHKKMTTKVRDMQLRMDQYLRKNEDNQLQQTGIRGRIARSISKLQLPDLGNVAIGNIPFQRIFGGISGVITNVAKNTGLILIYLLFLFMESKHFTHKIQNIRENNPQLMHTLTPVAQKINRDFIEYIKIKSIASAATGFLSFIVLKGFGVDFASFWAFIVFLLNFIPTVGSIIAVMFPITLAFIQFETFGPIIGVTAFLIGIQFLIGNFLEPRYLGKTLNLSPLVILISLGVWGKIWGILGMFLSVPIMVSINIILSQFEQTRNVAIFLSANGDIAPAENEE